MKVCPNKESSIENIKTHTKTKLCVELLSKFVCLCEIANIKQSNINDKEKKGRRK